MNIYMVARQTWKLIWRLLDLFKTRPKKWTWPGLRTAYQATRQKAQATELLQSLSLKSHFCYLRRCYAPLQWRLVRCLDCSSVSANLEPGGNTSLTVLFCLILWPNHWSIPSTILRLQSSSSQITRSSCSLLSYAPKRLVTVTEERIALSFPELPLQSESGPTLPARLVYSWHWK